MRRRFETHVATLGLLATLAACGGSTTAPIPSALKDDVGTLNGATVELTAEGGFAALSERQMVRHDDRSFLTVQRHLCADKCGAPADSLSGTLSAAATDSLFNIIWEHRNLQDDYGTTRGGADMMGYTLRISFNGETKTVRADDGTMPADMRTIVSAIRGIIGNARK